MSAFNFNEMNNSINEVDKAILEMNIYDFTSQNESLTTSQRVMIGRSLGRFHYSDEANVEYFMNNYKGGSCDQLDQLRSTIIAKLPCPSSVFNVSSIEVLIR
jgi:hypothetical protein